MKNSSRYTTMGAGLACWLLAGCFLFPPAIKHETLLTSTIEEADSTTDAAERYVLAEDGTVSWEFSGLRVEVDHMSDEELNEIFPDESTKGKYSTNPYTYGDWVDPRLGYTPNRFTVFKVTVYNRTFPKVMFSPLAAVLETDRGQYLRAYGITSASPNENFENYYRSRRGQSGNEFYRFELRMGTVRSYNYEEDQPIFKGENYGGYIVFDPIYPETKDVELTLKNFVLRFGAFEAPVESRDLRFVFAHRVEERVIQKSARAEQVDQALMISEDGPSRLLGNLPGDRSRNQSAIQALVRTRLSPLNRCFADEFDRGEASAGQVVLRFTIEVGGAISEVQVAESTVASQAVDDCIAQEARRWTFRPIDVAALQQQRVSATRTGGGEEGPPGSGGLPASAPAVNPLPVVVTYPFAFSLAE